MTEQPPTTSQEAAPQPAEPVAPALAAKGTTAAEDALHGWFAAQQTKSVDNLEAAARQIIALCTTLLTVLLGLLSLARDPLPVYLDAVAVRLVAGLGVLALFAALAAALSVVFPRPTPVVLNDPDSVQQAFDRLLKRKQNMLQTACFFFGAAMLCLVFVIAAALLRTAPLDVDACRTAAAPWWCGLRDLLQPLAR